MNTELATTSDIAANAADIATIRKSLNDHRGRSYATAHGGLVGLLTTYNDSNGDLVATRVLQVDINGVTLYIPCKIVVGDTPTT
jgi:hypothetical protein